MKLILIIALAILSSCNNKREHDVYSDVPQGQTNMVIVTTEHSVQGTATIAVNVEGKIDRTTTVTNNVLIEIDTLTRTDLFKLTRDVKGTMQTDIYTTVYRNNQLFKFHSFRSNVTDFKNTRTYILD